MPYREYQYTYVTTTATTGSTATMFTGKGTLCAITKNNAAGAGQDIIRVCDTATSSTTANVALFAVGVAPQTFHYGDGINIVNGLKVDVGNLADVTVVWCKP